VTFEASAESYDRFMGRYSRRLAPLLADFAGIAPEMRVLDVGCGPGSLSVQLAARVGAQLVAAIDPSEQFAKAWPTAADEQGFADRMNSLPKYVASTSLDEPLEWNSTLIKGDISDVVAELKGEYERDILIAGSAGLVHTLIPLGVIDEYRLMTFPVVLGSGKRLFRDGIPSLPLRLVHTAAFKSGVVVHSYEPDRSAS